MALEDNQQMLVLTCSCGQKMKVPGNLIGKACKCVKCGEKIEIGQNNTSPIANKPAATRELTGEQQKAPDARRSGSKRKRVGELLIEDKLITEEQLKDALELQAEKGGKTFQVLISLGYLDKNDLHEFLSRQSGVAAIALANYEIPKDIVTLIPAIIAKENLVLPIDKLGKLLTVAMACPLDEATIAALEEATGLRVKPMLARLEDIDAAIERYYPSKEAMEKRQAASFSFAMPEPEKKASKLPVPPKNELTERLTRLDSLPTFSDAANKLTKAVEESEKSIREIAKILGKTPSVSSRILSVANISAYGMPERVTSIELASALLGVDGVCDVITDYKLSGAVRDSGSFDQKLFHRDAVLCASASRELAASCNGNLSGVAYTAGLLHDLGRLALAECYPDHYARLDQTLCGKKLLEAEKQVLGMDHSEAGYLLAREWRLPVEICLSLRFHHDPASAKESEQIVALVALASLMTEFSINQENGGKAEPFSSKEMLKKLGLDEAAAVRIFGGDSADTLIARLPQLPKTLYLDLEK